MSRDILWEPDEWTATTPTLFSSIARYRYAIAAVTVVAALVGYLASSLRPPVYVAETNIFLSNGAAFGSTDDPASRVAQEAARLQSRTVLDRAYQNLGPELAESVIRGVETEPDPSTGILTVTVRATDPGVAADFANAIANAYQEVSRETVEQQVGNADAALSEQVSNLAERADRLEREARESPSDAAVQRRLDAVQAQLLELHARMSEVTGGAALFGSGVSDVETAIPPTNATGPAPFRYGVIAGLVALSLASAVAFWRSGTVARGHLEPTAILGAPLLAKIPILRQSSGSAGTDAIFNPTAAEAFQFLLSSFEVSIARTNTRSVLVTSPSPGDGKSLTSLHLARALALQGNDVVLVDSDIRARGLTKLLNAEGSPGLVSLADGQPLDTVVREYRLSGNVKLSVVHSGEPPVQPTGLLATTKYRKAIADITSATELTIIDSAPLLTVADPSAVATHVDAILLVLDAHTSEKDLLDVRERLELIPTTLLGYVVNRVADGSSSFYSYFGHSQPTARKQYLQGP